MKRIAFATIESYDGLGEETQAITTALAKCGIHVEILPLADLTVNPEQATAFDAILLHTTSGYHHALPNYLAQLDRLEQAGARLLNPPSIIRWNSDKHYLLDLEDQGIPTLPTLWIEPGDRLNLQTALDAQGWHDAVLKPAISAGAYETRHITRKDAASHQSWLDQLTGTPEKPGRSMMLQPFAPEVTSEGEWSFLFFNGNFSHCVLKTANQGDYRVQHVHGGTYTHHTSPPELLRDAEETLHHLPGDTLYARIDGIRRNNRLVVMEVELIEPFLYLLPDLQAVERFADAVAERVTRQAAAA